MTVSAQVRLLLTAIVLAGAPISAEASSCTGDCSVLGIVRVVDLKLAVQVALGTEQLGACQAGDADGDLAVRVDELVAAVRNLLSACPLPSSTPASATQTPTATPTPLPAASPPTDSTALLAWLQAGSYLDWHAESHIHNSVGPHFGRVRTFVNDVTFDSLSAGNASHPNGAALVKELYGSSGDDLLRGWSVMIKTQDDSAGGNGWYWLERFGSTTFAAGNGVSLCYGCHGGDYRGLETKDYVLTPFPLQ